MSRTTSKMLAIVTAGAAVVIALGACGQAPGQNNPQQASVSTTAEPAPVPSTDDTPTTQSSTKGSTPGGSAIGRDQAVTIALGRVAGGNVDEVENEFEHGRAAWKVRIVKDGTRYSVYIDKATGEIIRFRDEGRD